MRAHSSWPLALAVATTLAGCSNNFDPQSYVGSLRLLAVTADPPEVAAGVASTLTATWSTPDGSTPEISWAVCREPPGPTSGELNADCAANDLGAPLFPVGSGATVSVTMPADATLTSFGLPDPSDGLYLPVRAVLSDGSALLTGFYRLRFSPPGAVNPANRNPHLDDIFIGGSPDAGGQSTLGADDAPDVHQGDVIALRALLSADSAETYTKLLGGVSSVTETVTVSWYTTGGRFDHDVTGQAQPDTTLKLDKHLPASGERITLWMVAQDERGGSDVVERHLTFR